MLDPSHLSDAAAIIEAMRENHPVIINKIDDKAVAFAAVQEGTELKSIKHFLDEYLEKPERIAGTSSHDSLESFLSHVIAFKQTDRTVIFASERDTTLRAIYDYHKPDDPRFMEHKAIFNAKMSPRWKVWNNLPREGFTQAEFADFVETNALDLIMPPAMTSNEPADATVIAIAQTLGMSIATPAKMLELARGVSVNESNRAKNFYDPQSGQMHIEYKSEQESEPGVRFLPPGLFLIAIPVLDKEGAYRLVCKLRFRIKASDVRWFISIYQPEQAIEDAFNMICTDAANATGLPVYRGMPETKV